MENFSQKIENYQELNDYFSCVDEHTINLISTFLSNDQFSEAVETCFQYLENFPVAHLVQYQLLLGLLLSERQEEAQALLFEIMLQTDISRSELQVEPLKEFLHKEITQRLNSHKLTQVEKLLYFVTEIDNQDLWAYQNLGSIYLKFEAFEDALFAYRKVLDLNPNDPDALFNMGIILKSQNKLKEAEDYLKKVNSLGVYAKETFYHPPIQIYEARE